MEEMQQITLDQWLSWKEDIREKLRETAGNFVYIGFRLKQIRDSGMLDGAADIFEFAQKEYGLGKSTVSRFIAINEKFSEGGNSLELRKEFKAIGSSKLAEMLTLTDAECQMITEKTTVKEIRELKSFSRQQAPEEAAEQRVPEEAAGQRVPEEAAGQHAPEGDGSGGQKAQEGSRDGKPLTPLQKCLADFFRDKKGLLNEVIPAVCEARYRDAAELMNPSGHCTHKKGICFLFMEDYSTGVKAKLLTDPAPLTMTWPELLTELQSIFADIIASGVKDIHGAYYGAGETAGNGSGREVPKTEESPKKRNAEASVATSQREEKEEAAETAAKAEKKESEAAVMEDPEKESLPGQMEVTDDLDLMPTTHYEEIPAEDSGTEAAHPAAGGQEGPTEDSGTDTAHPAAGVEDETAGEDDSSHGDDALPDGRTAGDSGQQDRTDGAEEPYDGTEDYFFMDARNYLYSLQSTFAVWTDTPMPDQFLQKAHRDAVSLAAALERVMDKRGECRG